MILIWRLWGKLKLLYDNLKLDGFSSLDNAKWFAIAKIKNETFYDYFMIIVDELTINIPQQL